MPKTSTTVRILKPIAKLGGAAMPGVSARILEWLFRKPRNYAMPEREKKWITGAGEMRILNPGLPPLIAYAWGSGPTVLLVHGWSGRGSQMAVFAKPLVEAGFRVVAFDAPGHGPCGKGLTSLPEIADSVLRVAKAVGPVDSVLSHSLGGLAVTVAVSKGLCARRLVYISPPDTPLRYLYKASDYIGFGAKVAVLVQKSIERKLSYSFDRYKGSSLALKMRIPLRVIHDRDDKEVPFGEGRRLAEAWPGAEIITTRGLGHRRILRDPIVIRAAVDFLAPVPDAALAGPGHITGDRSEPLISGVNREYRLGGRNLMDAW